MPILMEIRHLGQVTIMGKVRNKARENLLNLPKHLINNC
jgi:hypothetical protein